LGELTHPPASWSGATDARSTPGTRTQVDLGDLVATLAARARRRTGQVIEVAADTSTVTGDAAAIERAVTNLVDNACKWNPPGTTIEITVRAGAVAVRDPAASPDERAVLSASPGTDAQSVPGSGLGLAIVGRSRRTMGPGLDRRARRRRRRRRRHPRALTRFSRSLRAFPQGPHRR
jgi:two-component system sensor histidine kinase MprB